MPERLLEPLKHAGAALSSPSNVLVVGNVIRTISRGDITADPTLALTTIDGGGRTLMPGLIDAHGHTVLGRSRIPGPDVERQPHLYGDACG